MTQQSTHHHRRPIDPSLPKTPASLPVIATIVAGLIVLSAPGPMTYNRMLAASHWINTANALPGLVAITAAGYHTPTAVTLSDDRTSAFVAMSDGPLPETGVTITLSPATQALRSATGGNIVLGTTIFAAPPITWHDLAPLNYPDGNLDGHDGWQTISTRPHLKITNYGTADHAVTNDLGVTTSCQARTVLPIPFASAVTVESVFTLTREDNLHTKVFVELYNDAFELIAGFDITQLAATPNVGEVIVQLYTDPDSVSTTVTLGTAATPFRMTFNDHTLTLYQGTTAILSTPTTSIIPVADVTHIWIGEQSFTAGHALWALNNLRITDVIAAP